MRRIATLGALTGMGLLLACGGGTPANESVDSSIHFNPTADASRLIDADSVAATAVPIPVVEPANGAYDISSLPDDKETFVNGCDAPLIEHRRSISPDVRRRSADTRFCIFVSGCVDAGRSIVDCCTNAYNALWSESDTALNKCDGDNSTFPCDVQNPADLTETCTTIYGGTAGRP